MILHTIRWTILLLPAFFFSIFQFTTNHVIPTAIKAAFWPPHTGLNSKNVKFFSNSSLLNSKSKAYY